MTTKNSTSLLTLKHLPQIFNNSQELGRCVCVLLKARLPWRLATAPTMTSLCWHHCQPMRLITALQVAADALGGSCTFNVGLYQTEGTVVDEDFWPRLLLMARGGCRPAHRSC